MFIVEVEVFREVGAQWEWKWKEVGGVRGFHRASSQSSTRSCDRHNDIIYM